MREANNSDDSGRIRLSLQLSKSGESDAGTQSSDYQSAVNNLAAYEKDLSILSSPTPEVPETPGKLRRMQAESRQELIARQLAEAYGDEETCQLSLPGSPLTLPSRSHCQSAGNTLQSGVRTHVAMVDNPLCSASDSPQLPPCYDGISSPRQMLQAPGLDAEAHLTELKWEAAPGTDACAAPPPRERLLGRNQDAGIPAYLPRVALSTPLPLSRDVEDRITSLGPELPYAQKAILWLGIALDVGSKAGLCWSLVRFARRGRYWWFGASLGFFVTSSLVCVMYWMTHYPAALEKHLQGSPDKGQANSADALVYGLRKGTFKKWVRRAGTLCAVLQLGTAFAATRALFSSEARQRLVEMDLRGMRLADTVFLTLGTCLLQVIIGMSCAHQAATCMNRTLAGFDIISCASILAALFSSALAFLSLEINDHRFMADRSHQLELAALFAYRLAELSARVTLLALFASVRGFWVLLVLGAHALAVVLLLRCTPFAKGQKRIWDKAAATQQVRACGCVRLRLPKFDDVKLLVACMAWPPSVFVSDATDCQGRFWWRSRLCGRKSSCDVTAKARIIAFPAFSCLMAAEAAALMGVMWGTGVPAWAEQYVGVAAVLQVVWCFVGMLWLASVHCSSLEHHRDDLSRMAAQQESLHMKTLRALLPRKGAKLQMLPVLTEDADVESCAPAGCHSRDRSASLEGPGSSPAHWLPSLLEATHVRQILTASLGVQVSHGQYQEGPLSCPAWRPLEGSTKRP